MTLKRFDGNSFTEVSELQLKTSGIAENPDLKIKTSNGWKPVWIDVQGKDIIDTLETSNIGQNSATIKGSLKDLGNASGADCWFKYRLAGDQPVNETQTQTLGKSENFSADISGLQKGMEYDFWALAKVGEEVYAGKVKTFQTIS